MSKIKNNQYCDFKFLPCFVYIWKTMRSLTSSKQTALPGENVNKPEESEHYTKMDCLTMVGSLFRQILLASPPVWTTKTIPPLSFFFKYSVPSDNSRLLKSSSPGASLRPFSTLNFLEHSSFTATTNSTMVNSPVKSPAKRLMSSPAKHDSPLKKLQLNDQESPVKGSRRDEEQSPSLYFVKLSDKAHAPTKGSKLAAGYDLKSACECVVPARGSCLVKTDIKIKLPAGTYGRVAPRSGLALKNKIDVGAGVIDEDYRGPVGVILFNHGDQEFKINEGDRIAQLICEKISYPKIVEVKDLDDTERGDGGFGSTGVANERAKMDTSV